MPRAAVKPEYGPTLLEMLAPRWRGASRATRRGLIAACVLALAVLVALVLDLLNASYSRGGSVPFSFSYRGLYRTAPEPGGYVRVERRHSDGVLEFSFAVGPIRLPPYRGEQTGALPIFATSFERALQRRYRGFELRGEGRTQLSKSLSGYQVAFTALIAGRQMYGRDVLLLPARSGAREGLAVAMLSEPRDPPQVDTPLEVATTGLLLRPLKSFSIG